MSKYAIVGGGVAGLSSAIFLLKQGTPALSIEIFECEAWGGQIHTEQFNNCLLEAGPDSILSRTPLFKMIASEIGLLDKIVSSEKESEKRYIVKEGRLVKVPTSPLSFFFTELMFFPEKIKIFLALGKKFSLWSKITLFEFARNILGFSAAEYLASPFARGIYGSEAEDLEFSSAFPQLYTALKKAPTLKAGFKEYSRERKEFWLNHFPGQEEDLKRSLYTFAGGLSLLITAMKEYLKSQGVKMHSAKISGLRKMADGYTLVAKSQKFTGFYKVYFTISPADLSKILKEEKPELVDKFSQFKSSPINVVYSAWDKKVFNQPGFGFLVPRKAQMSILGSIFASNVFKNRAPENVFLVKTMIAGDSSLFSDQELSDVSFENHKRLFKIQGQPLWTKVFRHSAGIPRYFPGFSDLNAEISESMQSFPGVILAGWHFAGVGISDALENAYRFALSSNS